MRWGKIPPETGRSAGLDPVPLIQRCEVVLLCNTTSPQQRRRITPWWPLWFPFPAASDSSLFLWIWTLTMEEFIAGYLAFYCRYVAQPDLRWFRPEHLSVESSLFLFLGELKTRIWSFLSASCSSVRFYLGLSRGWLVCVFERMKWDHFCHPGKKKLGISYILQLQNFELCMLINGFCFCCQAVMWTNDQIAFYFSHSLSIIE